MGRAKSYSKMIPLLAGVALAGCTDGGMTLLILQNQLPKSGDRGCEVSSDATQPGIARGRIDSEGGIGYQFSPVIQNIAAEIMGNPGQRIAILQGADVELTLVPGILPDDNINQQDVNSLTRFSQQFAGQVQPGGGTAAVQFPIVPTALLAALEPHLAADGTQPTPIEAKIRVFGTMDGGEVESQRFTYFVDVCRGCMKIDNGLCTELAADFVAAKGGCGNPLQDVKVDCCKVNTQNDDRADWRCPAVPSAVDDGM